MNWSNNWGKTDPNTLNWSNSPPATDKTPIVTKGETAPSNPLDAKSQDELLVLWQAKKDALAKAKDDEMDLRKYIVSRAFPQAAEGTNTVELGNGYALKAVVKFNYNLADNDTVERTLDKIAKIGNQGAFIAERLVSWTPSFKLTEYRNLVEAGPVSAEAQEILAAIGEMLVINDAAPTLEIKEPRKKK
jgi:hypothetical protein